MDPPDQLEEYLRGESPLSRLYKREPAPTPPHGLDRRVLKLSKTAQGKPPYLAPLAFAASVFLSIALVLAIVFGPQTVKHTDDSPRLIRVVAQTDSDAPLNRRSQLYSSDPLHTRAPAAWLADIAALRRAGRYREADAELNRFRNIYPNYPIDESSMRP